MFTRDTVEERTCEPQTNRTETHGSTTIKWSRTERNCGELWETSHLYTIHTVHSHKKTKQTEKQSSPDPWIQPYFSEDNQCCRYYLLLSQKQSSWGFLSVNSGNFNLLFCYYRHYSNCYDHNVVRIHNTAARSLSVEAIFSTRPKSNLTCTNNTVWLHIWPHVHTRYVEKVSKMPSKTQLSSTSIKFLSVPPYGSLSLSLSFFICAFISLIAHSLVLSSSLSLSLSHIMIQWS